MQPFHFSHFLLTERPASVHDASGERVPSLAVAGGAAWRAEPAAAAGRTDGHVQARAQHLPLHGDARRDGC